MSRCEQPDLKTLELFVGVVRSGSVAKAAAEAGIPHPSATLRLRELERSVGCRLLVQGSSRIGPTAEGCEVLVAAASLLAGSDRFVRRVAEIRMQRSDHE